MFPIHTLEKHPPLLTHIPTPPETLYIRGALPDTSHTFLTVIGSRKYSDYAEEVLNLLIEGLKGHPFVIVSGLALGIDALAHKKALDVNLPTLAIPGSGLDDSVLYPKTNRPLAHSILESGGCLLSEFDPLTRAQPWTFPQRNRIMAGISHGVLAIECRAKSGTRITTRFATEYSREVLAVPGDITEKKSEGTNILIQEGATPVTSAEDILSVFRTQKEIALPFERLSEEEVYILSILKTPRTPKELETLATLPPHRLTVVLSSLEIKGKIFHALGKIQRN